MKDEIKKWQSDKCRCIYRDDNSIMGLCFRCFKMQQDARNKERTKIRRYLSKQGLHPDLSPK